MPVSDFAFESLERRVKALEDAREKESKERFEKSMRRNEAVLRAFFFVMLLAAAVVWTAIITAEVVGD